MRCNSHLLFSLDRNPTICVFRCQGERKCTVESSDISPQYLSGCGAHTYYNVLWFNNSCVYGKLSFEGDIISEYLCSHLTHFY